MGTTFTGLSGKKASDFGHGKASLITYMNVFSNPIANPNMIENVEVDSRQREVEVGDVFFTTSSETPDISNIIFPSLTTATHLSTAP